MINNIIGFIVYLMTTIVLSPSTAVLMVFIKENLDRCFYYNGSWNKTDITIGCVAVVIGIIIRCFIKINL